MNDDILVFDAGPLNHFAREGWLGVLKAVVGSRAAVIPDVVVHELRVGASLDSRIEVALQADWIEHRELCSSEELESFARFSALLVKRDRSRGEAAVLALATTTGGTAVVDDGAARREARECGVRLQPTLTLLCEAVRKELLTIPLVAALADDLLASQYRLPFGPGGFEKWARDNGALS